MYNKKFVQFREIEVYKPKKSYFTWIGKKLNNYHIETP